MGLYKNNSGVLSPIAGRGKVVDTVEDGNMSAVSSNAVFDVANELLFVKSFTVAGTNTPVGGVSDYNINVSLSGYTAIGIVGTLIGSGGTISLVTSMLNSTNNAFVRLINNGTAAITPNSININVLYKKTL